MNQSAKIWNISTPRRRTSPPHLLLLSVSVSPNTEPNHTEKSAPRPHRFQELRSGVRSQKLTNRGLGFDAWWRLNTEPNQSEPRPSSNGRCSLQIPGEIWMLGFRA
ncbi:hypothetical protein L3X38_014068 [Prunus dulcis]|uniref:Uncharacterized protein n=1 Tax=Prunus dulcis TaxID=3755 RepID=A0AAD4WP60_PRUDU|nr:hypothetical protein L3X38_014068 [Prunus dulcis]